LEQSPRKLIDLAEVRADGWFEQLGEDIPDFDQLCQAMGRRFVAFSMIAGVHVRSVNYDTHSPHTSLVEFSIGEAEESQQMPLGELRERLGTALLAGDEQHPELEDDPTLEDIRRFIGRRYLLLAPVFSLGIEAIEVGGDDEPMIKLRLGNGLESISLQGLRDVIHNAIRSEIARARPSQAFSIDFKKVPMAESANARGDFDETIALLGSWPGPLSMFLRTPQGQSLGGNERSKLVRALCALGEAYLRKRQAEWSEDVLRLGIQFGQELEASAPLFGLLGRARVETGRYGEAIGLLRRALSLGADPSEYLPLLARCFLERGRYVAALACVDEALDAGAPREAVSELQARIAEALGPAYERYQTLIHD
jgi:tetratricopeptide (TPR) repeat protein